MFSSLEPCVPCGEPDFNLRDCLVTLTFLVAPSAVANAIRPAIADKSNGPSTAFGLQRGKQAFFLLRPAFCVLSEEALIFHLRESFFTVYQIHLHPLTRPCSPGILRQDDDPVGGGHGTEDP